MIIIEPEIWCGHSAGSTYRLRLGEFPCAIEDFGSRAQKNVSLGNGKSSSA